MKTVKDKGPEEDPGLRPPEDGHPRSCIGVVKQRVVRSEMLPPEEDFLAIEDPLQIDLAFDRSSSRVRKTLVLTMRTPGHDAEMIAGFLYTEGIIERASDIVSMEFSEPSGSAPPTQVTVDLRNGLEFFPDRFHRHFVMHSGCGVCGKTSLKSLVLPRSLKIDDATQVDREWIHQLPRLMGAVQPVFSKTGGLHAASIFSVHGDLLATREDIGRHNALDKAIGAGLLTGDIPMPGRILCVSGRMSYEILQKALMARIPIIAGFGAPSSLAVTLANDFNVTLLGFVREDSYNVYSCQERLR